VIDVQDLAKDGKQHESEQATDLPQVKDDSWLLDFSNQVWEAESFVKNLKKELCSTFSTITSSPFKKLEEAEMVEGKTDNSNPVPGEKDSINGTRSWSFGSHKTLTFSLHLFWTWLVSNARCLLRDLRILKTK
jgi:hypothetical protein